MNERIKELIKSLGIIPENEHYEVAEMIVRECAGMLETNGNAQRTLMFMEPGPHSKSADWLEGYREAATLYGSFLLKDNARRIKKHFGVNE